MQKVVIALFFLFSFSELFGQKTAKLVITPLIDDFYVFTTYRSFNGNPFPSNGMYVVTQNGVVLIDSPWDTTQFQPLLDSIKIKHNKEATMCIATHSHEDRTGGLEYYRGKGIRTFTTRQTDDISKERKEKRAEYLIEKDSTFTLGKYTFKTYYGGEGHTADNIVIWFGKEKILYGGCMVKSVESKGLGFIGDANIREWKKTIKHIRRKFKRPNYIITGHQSWESKKALKHTLRLIRKYLRENK